MYLRKLGSGSACLSVTILVLWLVTGPLLHPVVVVL
jgi:hypothetical protein